MWTKICANTNLDDALLAVELGAEAVGFVFAKSKRQVTSEQVMEITRRLPDSVEKVGVFGSDDPFEIQHDVACSGLTGAQLHRAYDAELVRMLSGEFGGKLKIIQVVPYELDPEDREVADDRFAATLEKVFADRLLWAVLIDAKKSGVSGGLGVAFDWKHVAGIVAGATTGSGEQPRVILAGGLNAENVAEAISEFQPWGVDVASGVEASPGVKDPRKLKSFLRNSVDASRHAGS
jgi:phosphoribosylanthranilate isomerase